jgi:hypothetical protein
MVEEKMNNRCIITLVLLSLLITNCSLPRGGKTPEIKTSTPEILLKSLTPTKQTKVTSAANATDTPVHYATPTPIPTLKRPLKPTLTPFPEIWYIIQTGTPLATYNTPHEAAGCSWLGVGGQVFGFDTTPELGVSILVGGTLEGYQVGSLGTTGMETNIGEGGYEITLADHPVDSSGTLWIQIVDSIGNPLSEKKYFDTYKDCDRNFILINYVRYQASPPTGSGWPAYLPLITNRTVIQSTPNP